MTCAEKKGVVVVGGGAESTPSGLQRSLAGPTRQGMSTPCGHFVLHTSLRCDAVFLDRSCRSLMFS